LKIPVKYIGVGEHPADIAAFDAQAFVEALSSG
jgi:signal recognition particle GTPase